MRKALVLKPVLLLLTICVAGCVKEKADNINTPQPVAAIEVQRIAECHNESNPYPSQINAHIEGTWVWASKGCDGGSATSADKQVVITFNDGGLYKVFESSRIVSQGSWSLTQSGDSWEIVTTSPSAYINGQVLLCNNDLVFYSGAVGCNYYFTR